MLRGNPAMDKHPIQDGVEKLTSRFMLPTPKICTGLMGADFTLTSRL